MCSLHNPRIQVDKRGPPAILPRIRLVEELVMHRAICLLVLVLVPTPLAAQSVGPTSTCAEAQPCRPDVRFLGDVRGCACFSCETGQRSEYRTCTRKEAEKKALMQKSFEPKARQPLEKKR
jgi:hypothetical protein